MPQTDVSNMAQRVIRSTQANFPPTVGIFFTGDRIEYTDPSAGGFIGQVCTVAGDYAGTPPTWKTFGAITA